MSLSEEAIPILFVPHDIIFICDDGERLSFWKKILISCSDYFKAKFSSCMKDSSDIEICVDICSSILSDILSCAYRQYTGNYRESIPVNYDIEKLIIVFEFIDQYQFFYIINTIQIRITNCHYSRHLLNFVREREPVFLPDKKLVEKLLYYFMNNCHLEIAPLSAKDIDEKILINWLSYSEQIYNYKKDVSQLKVAYLCGPEPENDLDHLVSLGFRIENIYAFESDNEVFETAIKAIKVKYHNLKIFNGKIDDFIKSTFVKFDVV